MLKLSIPKIKKLKASTLIEVIVASVIFLIIFSISLDTLTQLTTSTKDTTVYVDVNYRMNACFREYSKEDYISGEFEHSYYWGVINIKVLPYKDYPNLKFIEIKAGVNNDRRILESRHIVEMNDEDRNR